MSMSYGLCKRITADELFDGRLKEFGVFEEVPAGAMNKFPPYMKVKEVRYLTDGRNSMEVVVYENGVPDLTVGGNFGAPPSKRFFTLSPKPSTPISYPNTTRNIGVLIRKRIGMGKAEVARMRRVSTTSY